MEKTKSILMRAAVGALLCVAFATASAVLVNADICFAICDTYDTALEAAYGGTYRDIHENRLAGSPLEAVCPDGVDTATGRLILTRTDLSLEGTGGMDFELVRFYDSNEATLGRATVENVPELEVDTVWLDYKGEDKTGRRLVASTSVLSGHKKALKNLLAKYTKGEGNRGVSLNGKKDIVKNTQRTKTIRKGDHDVYGLASGWRYDLPWIETVFLTEKKDWGDGRSASTAEALELWPLRPGKIMPQRAILSPGLPDMAMRT